MFSQHPLTISADDRGHDRESASFRTYKRIVGDTRVAANLGDKFVLDQGSVLPVTATFAAVDGNGTDTDNEPDLSLVAVVKLDGFRAEIGRDLGGQERNNYKHIGASLAPKAGRIDGYQVQHHCNAYRPNEKRLATTQLTVAIISAGNNNPYDQPT